MADIFISYAQTRRDLAQALALDLEAAGLTVWWDFDLVPHQNFRKEIDAQLDAARAVIVLWTAESIGSLWVPSEADHALRQGKLVNTHAREIAPEQIPKPFNQIHSVDINNHGAIIVAVQHSTRGVQPVDAHINVSDPVHLAETLGGRNLYGAGGFAPTRELLQNAVDAVRMRRTHENREPGWGRVRVLIVEEAANGIKEPWLHVDDDGLGMSEQELTGALLDFGRSYWSSDRFQTEFPGLASQTIKSIGKYGIGFFSVFLLGDEVRVVSRRFNKGAEDARVLEFRSIRSRPLLRKSRSGELPQDFSTRISVKLRSHELLTAAPENIEFRQRRLARQQAEEPIPLSDRRRAFIAAIRRLVAGVDVEVDIIDLTNGIRSTHEWKWDTLAPEDFLREIFPAELATPANRTLHTRFISGQAPLLSDVRGSDGTNYGRAAISILDADDRIQQGSKFGVSVGGFIYPSRGRLPIVGGIVPLGVRSMAARAYWKGYLKLSLVTCPVALYPASSKADKTRFHQINKKTGHRLRQQMVDEETGRVVDKDNKGRGYELTKGKFVEIEPEEIDAIEFENTHTIDIDKFVPEGEIDKRYHERPYYIVPDGKSGEEAYAVIRDAMKDKGRVALAGIIFANRQHILAIEPWGKGMLGTTLRYDYEVRDEKEFFKGIGSHRVPKEMVSLASHILDTKAGRFDPAKFKDEYELALRKLVKRKAAGKTIEAPEEKEDRSNVIDLMEALRQSVKGKGRKAAALRSEPDDKKITPARKGKSKSARSLGRRRKTA